jgi:16S rRNA processing protein RimM
MSKEILIAKVISPFGIKGDVKLVVFLENFLDIEKYPLFDSSGKKINLKINNKNKTAIASNASGDAIIIAKIAGIDDRNASENLRNFEIFTSRENFKETQDDEFYHVDLIGLDVIDEKNKKIAKIINIYDFGAGNLVEIEFIDEAPKGFKKIENFSFKNEIFPEVNLSKNFIKIILPEIINAKEE